MNIERPETLYCATQPFDWRGKLHQSLTIGYGFDLSSGIVVPAARVLAAAVAGLSPGDCLDMGLPKPQAEWLLAGSARTPGRIPASSLLLEIRVGASARRFLVSGEAGGRGGPEPFTDLALTWADTFGGPDNPENPLGCGLAPDPSTGRTRPPRIVGADDVRARPACPGPCGAWPIRMRGMGTYDKKWLQTRCPGLPDDCDLGFCNLAQADQRLPAGLRGDEDILLRGVHHERAEIVSRLPGKTILVHVLRGAAAGEQVFSLAFDTLWLFPDSLLGLLLGHLLVPCSDEAGSDIARIRLELIPPDPPAPEAPAAVPAPPVTASLSVAATAAATAAAAAVTSAAPAAAAAVSSATPAAAAAVSSAAPAAAAATAAAAPPPLDVSAVAEMREAALREFADSLDDINDGLSQAGLPPLTPGQVAATREAIASQSAAMEKLLEQVNAAPEPDLPAILRQAGLSEDLILRIGSAQDIPFPDPAGYADQASWNGAVEGYLDALGGHLPLSAGVRESQRAVMRLLGPGGEDALVSGAGPEPTLAGTLAQTGIAPDKAALLAGELEKDQEFSSFAELQAYFVKLETLGGFPPGSMTSVLDQANAAAAKEGIDLFPAEEPRPPAPPVAGGPPVSAAVPGEAPPAPPDASGAGRTDFSGRDLKGRDFAGKMLDGVDFSGSSLRGADFSKADCAEANFRKAVLDGASFAGAGLALAVLAGATAGGAHFSRTDLSKADCSGLKAEEADFSGADLSGARLPGADLSGAILQDVHAPGLDASGANFRSAALRGGDFQAAVFAGAGLQKADVSASSFEQGNFSGADLSGAALRNKSRVSGADFSGAVLSDSSWEGTEARNAVFDGGTAGEGRFAGCDFRASSWRNVHAPGADFSRCDLREALFPGSNLMRASLREARVQGSNFSGANLYGADDYRCALESADLRGALLGKTLFAARRGA
ncbi:MAG: DUF2169 domain-containing protein [Desulfovibrio sp.]|jgi:uncharacterized protein YjbI with pentapeptide repeats|nr:DUF2169 domain-containing protein [Desulfovibrio sp.]